LHQPLEISQIIKAMVGDLQSAVAKTHDKKGDSKLVLELRDLIVEGSSSPINLKIYAGEIVGLIGLIGAGKTELAETLFGMRKPMGGEILLDGKSVDFKDIHQAIKHGVHMVPENRTVNAIIPEESIGVNITLPFLDFFSKYGVLSKRNEVKASKRMIKDMGIKCEGEEAKIESLSGGNQQKVVVARWLLMKHNIVILDEPFQGVDIKSRRDISEYLRESTKKSSVLMISSDIDELVDVTDRIVVMNKGRILSDEKTSQIDRDRLLSLITQE